MNISLHSVNYIYEQGRPDEKQALFDISAEIRQGEFIAILGSSGSGKSTMLQLLNGLLKPTAGEILFDGQMIPAGREEKKALRALRCRVGVAFQYPEYQLFETDVLKDAAFGPKNMGFSETEANERAGRALRDAGVREELFAKSPFELSGGEMRRAALAGVLAMEPEVLALDEPTAGLDPEGSEQILALLDSLHEKGMTVIMVSHNMEEAAAHADRLMVLCDGRLAMDGKARDVLGNSTGLKAYGLEAPESVRLLERLQKEGWELDPSALTPEETAERIWQALQR